MHDDDVPGVNACAATRTYIGKVGQENVEARRTEDKVPYRARPCPVRPLVAVRPDLAELHGRIAQILPEREGHERLVEQVEIQIPVALEGVRFSLPVECVVA